MAHKHIPLVFLLLGIVTLNTVGSVSVACGLDTDIDDDDDDDEDSEELDAGLDVCWCARGGLKPSDVIGNGAADAGNWNPETDPEIPTGQLINGRMSFVLF